MIKRTALKMCLIVPVALAWPVFGKTVRPYSAPLVEAENFERMVVSIRRGDEICFNDGKCFKVLGVVQGDSNMIFKIGDGKILRLNFTDDESTSLVPEILRSYPIFEAYGLPVVKVYTQKSSPHGEYLIADEVPVKFTLNTFLERRQPTRLLENFSYAAAPSIWQKLVDFFAAFYAFGYIEDLRPEQVAWTGEDWILLDWRAETTFAYQRNRRTRVQIWGIAGENWTTRGSIPLDQFPDGGADLINLSYYLDFDTSKLEAEIKRRTLQKRRQHGFVPVKDCSNYLRANAKLLIK